MQSDSSIARLAIQRRWHLGRDASHTAWIRALPDGDRSYLAQVLEAEGADERAVVAFTEYRPGTPLHAVGASIGLSTTRTTQLLAQALYVLARASAAWGWGDSSHKAFPCVVRGLRGMVPR